MGNAIYRVHNLKQAYQQRTVLQIEALEIFRGEILAIVGPSGAGKSTLLRHLNFLEEPTAGHLTFQDSRFNGVMPPLALRRQVTTVFQQPVLLNRSVAANVAYGLRLRGKSGRQVDQRVSDALAKVGLAAKRSGLHWLERWSSTLRCCSLMNLRLTWILIISTSSKRL